MTASVKRAAAGLKSLKTGISGLGSAAGSIVGKLTSVSSALAGIAGAAGLTALVKNSFDSIDAVGKMSAKLGIASENLIAFQHQASLAGVESGTFEKALQKMVSGIDDAGRGIGTAKDAFAALNLDPSKLASGSTEDAYKQIADAIAKTEGAQKQLALTTQIFGQRGADLIHILRQGSAGFEETRAEVERLGTAFSDVESIQIQNANDAVNTLGKTIGGVANRIAIGLAPIVEEIAKRFTNWISSMNSGLGITTAITGGVIKAFGFFSDLVYGLKLLWKIVEVAANGFFLGVVTGVQMASEALDSLLVAVGLSATGLTEEIGFLVTALEEQLQKTGEEFQALADAGRPSDRITKEWEAITKSAKQAAEAAAEIQKQTREAVPDMEALVNPTKKVEDILAGLRDQLDKLTVPEELRILRELTENNATQEQLDEAKRLLDEINAVKDGKIDKKVRLPDAPAALTRGSIEARSAELAGLRRLSGGRESDRIQKEQLTTQKQSKSALEQIRDIVRSNGLVVVDA